MDLIAANVFQNGPTPGAQKMMRAEFMAAKRSQQIGVYGMWSCMDQKGYSSLNQGGFSSYNSQAKTQQQFHQPNISDLDFCSRIGPASRCFCGHMYKDHIDTMLQLRRNPKLSDQQLKSNPQYSGCRIEGCECECFLFMPSRPEEIGEWWLVRRKGFDVRQWRAKCKCGKTHEEHRWPQKRPGTKQQFNLLPLDCSESRCSGFRSAWTCINCDKPWEAHETVYELEEDRIRDGKKVKEAYYPLVFEDNDMESNNIMGNNLNYNSNLNNTGRNQIMKQQQRLTGPSQSSSSNQQPSLEDWFPSKKSSNSDSLIQLQQPRPSLKDLGQQLQHELLHGDTSKSSRPHVSVESMNARQLRDGNGLIRKKLVNGVPVRDYNYDNGDETRNYQNTGKN